MVRGKSSRRFAKWHGRGLRSMDRGMHAGVTSEERARIKALERENKELNCARPMKS